MSKRARHAQTVRFVKRGPAWPELGAILQEALPAHVFTGDVFDGGMQLRLHMPEYTQHVHVTVHKHVRRLIYTWLVEENKAGSRRATRGADCVAGAS